MGELILREATAADIPVIRELAGRIWPVCYREIITPEQISYMLEMMYSEASLLRQMTDENCRFTLAWSDGQPVGFSSVSQKERGLFRLHKLYVDTTLHRKGIGATLLADVIRYAAEHGADVLELNVNKMNPAVQFYLAKGFKVWREEVLDIGNGFVMDDYVMRLPVKA